MDEQRILKGVFTLIKKDLMLEESFEVKGEFSIDELCRMLAKQIQYFLDHDFSHLLNALYRIDIPQNRVEEILTYAEPQKIALKLSEAIIEREQQKMITRIKYSQ